MEVNTIKIASFLAYFSCYQISPTPTPVFCFFLPTRFINIIKFYIQSQLDLQLQIRTFLTNILVSQSLGCQKELTLKLIQKFPKHIQQIPNYRNFNCV